MKRALILIFSAALLVACKKPDKTEEVSVDRISSSLYPYLFQPDSYWVYENALSSQRDSIYVTGIEKDYMYSPGRKTEKIGIGYSSSKQGAYSELLIGYVITNGGTVDGYLFLSSKKVGDHSVNATILNVFDSLKVGDRWFKQVTKMKIDKDYEVQIPQYRYYCDEAGLIKKELLDSNYSIIETWNLLKFNTSLMQP